MRLRDLPTEQKRCKAAFRLFSILGLALLTLPFAHSATLGAPPESEHLDSSVPTDERRSVDATDWAASELEILPEDAPLPTASDVAERAGQEQPDRSGAGSVRPRGVEAPVQLETIVADAVRAEAAVVDPGDGASTENRSRTRDTNAKSDSKPERGIRIWPMRANTYTFTQAFGCTQQIANFYFPDPGCPASAPVVHSGIDLAAPEGTPFYAAASGWVVGSGYDREIGVPNTRIIIQHDGRDDGFSTEYLHWIASYVEVGDYVEAGEMIGEVGSVGYSTGPHLHFSLVDLATGEHADPIRWLPDEAGSEGYRGKLPNARAHMRLPAGTTAGLPETADPAPPPPAVRQDVPDSPRDKTRRDRSQGKHDGQARTSRSAKKDHAKRKSDAASATGDETTADQAATETTKTERTHKRERDKNGKSKETSDIGVDGEPDRATKEPAKSSKRKDGPNERKSANEDRGDQRQSRRNDNQNPKDNNTSKDKKNENKGKDNAGGKDSTGNGNGAPDGPASEDPGNSADGSEGANGNTVEEDIGSGKDADGANGTNGDKGDDSQSGDGGNGGNGEKGGSSLDNGTGGRGGRGGDGGSGRNGGDGGSGGSGGEGKTGGDGGNGGNGGSATNGQGGDGGSGGAGGDAKDL